MEALVIALIGTIFGLFCVQMILSRPEYWLGTGRAVCSFDAEF